MSSSVKLYDIIIVFKVCLGVRWSHPSGILLWRIPRHLHLVVPKSTVLALVHGPVCGFTHFPSVGASATLSSRKLKPYIKLRQQKLQGRNSTAHGNVCCLLFDLATAFAHKVTKKPTTFNA
jgi:hypothetical protein